MAWPKPECFVGIHVSHLFLDIAIYGEATIRRHDNNETDIAKVVKQIRDINPTLIVVAASDGWEIPLVSALTLAQLLGQLPVVVVSPTWIHDFAQTLGQIAAAKVIDAHLIAHFAQAVQPEACSLRNEEVVALNNLMTRRHQVNAMLKGEKNRLYTVSKPIKDHIENHIAWLVDELESLHGEIAQLIRQSPIWQDNATFPVSVPGAGHASQSNYQDLLRFTAPAW